MKKTIGVNPHLLLKDSIINHGLESELVVNCRQNGSFLNWTLYGISDTEKEFVIPTSFLDEWNGLVSYAKKWWEGDGKGGKRFEHSVSKETISFEEIKKRQESWNTHCEMFNVCYD